MKGGASDRSGNPEDLLVYLYKAGAGKDLSNVRIQFLIRGDRVVLRLHAQQPDGSMSRPVAVGLGRVKDPGPSGRRG